MRGNDATRRVRAWLEHPHVQILTPGDRHADAHLAALAIEYQAELVSADTDFARFPRLRWFNPLQLQ